jgi:transcriptional regulator with XRE-family HTH domain
MTLFLKAVGKYPEVLPEGVLKVLPCRRSRSSAWYQIDLASAMNRPRQRCCRCGNSPADNVPNIRCEDCQGKQRLGRPQKPLDPDASHTARLGAEVRKFRNARGLTQSALAAEIGFSAQRVSEVELGRAPATGPFVTACERALEAGGVLKALLPAVIHEQAQLRYERADARRAGATPVSSEYSAAENDVDPLSRRNLISAGAGAALGLGATSAPAAARDVDPQLVDHWTTLMALLDRHDAVHGSHGVRDAARQELKLIADHRKIARGQLRANLLRVESCWSDFAAWLSHDMGDIRARDNLAEQALRLAQEADWPDMVAYIVTRRSRWALAGLGARRAVTLAKVASRTPGMSDRLRVLCLLQEAQGHALGDDATACQRRLADVYAVLDKADPAEAPQMASLELMPDYIAAAEARCWLWLRPRKAIDAYQHALSIWPRERPRSACVHQVRLALAHTAAGEPERAAAEGTKALRVAQDTRSQLAARELRRLNQELAAYDAPAVADFREAFAAL